MKNLLNERSGKLFKKLFENQGIDTGKYENYSLDEEGPKPSGRRDIRLKKKSDGLSKSQSDWRMTFLANEFADMADRWRR